VGVEEAAAVAVEIGMTDATPILLLQLLILMMRTGETALLLLQQLQLSKLPPPQQSTPKMIGGMRRFLRALHLHRSLHLILGVEGAEAVGVALAAAEESHVSTAKRKAI
jgi:hypothetical protein